MVFDLILDISLIWLSFLYFGLTTYRVFNIIKYVIYAQPQAVMYMD